MKVTTLGASLHRNSINAELARYTSTLIKGANPLHIDLNNYQFPIYSPSLEESEMERCKPQIFELLDIFKNSDLIVVSFAEYNGSFTSGFKNTIDWVSRLDKKVFQDKPCIFMSTSPGGRGGVTVLDHATAVMSHMGANILFSFSLPNYYDNYESGVGIKSLEHINMLKSSLKAHNLI